MGQFFLFTLKFENVINLLLLYLSNLEYKTILLCCHKQSPRKCYSARFLYYNTFLDSVFFGGSDQDLFRGTYCRIKHRHLTKDLITVLNTSLYRLYSTLQYLIHNNTYRVVQQTIIFTTTVHIHYHTQLYI